MPIPALALAAGASAIGNIGGTLIGNAARKNAQQRSFKYNTEMWNKQNAYNTPKMQMQRFTEAGLNKNLMYGQGTHGNASDMPKHQAPQIQDMQMPDLQAPIMNQYQKKLIQANTANVQKQTEVQQADKELKIIQALVSGSKDPKSGQLLDIMQKKYQTDFAEGSVRKQQQETSNLQLTGKSITKDLTYKQIQNEEAEIKKAMTQLDHKWMRDNNLSRLDPTAVKLAWRLVKQGKMGLKEALLHIIRTTGNANFRAKFKN